MVTLESEGRGYGHTTGEVRDMARCEVRVMSTPRAERLLSHQS
jgi:hypothetical protein